MSEPGSTLEDLERRLRDALRPVEPPVHLQRKLEATLNDIVELAAEELESWELVAIKDPRNWPRAALGPATAVVVGGGAAVGLVVLRTQRKRHKRRAQAKGVRDLAARTVTDATREAKKVLGVFAGSDG
jgi:chaperonin GroEL (HSP60 family)